MISVPIWKHNGKLERAREMRRDMTPQERKLWFLFLKRYPVKIYKQRIMGPYIVDFYCASAKLVIEVDGSQHFEDPGQHYDKKRTEFLESFGLRVVRYSNRDINCNFEAVCEDIHNKIQQYRKTQDADG